MSKIRMGASAVLGAAAHHSGDHRSGCPGAGIGEPGQRVAGPMPVVARQCDGRRMVRRQWPSL
jgi:hypothetical protein